jgi:hypothetical protein
VDRLASPCSIAIERSCFPQCAAALGVHVGFGACYLLQPEVADMVEGANPNHSSGLAFGSLPSGLAGNGRRIFLGCESPRTATATHNLAVGDHRNNSRCSFVLGCGAIFSQGEPLIKIMWEMNLPSKNMDKETDSHYRCFACLYGRSEDLL